MNDSDLRQAVGRLSGCPYCDALLRELTKLRRRCDMLERLVRVESALARQLSRSMQLNAELQQRVRELEAQR